MTGSEEQKRTRQSYQRPRARRALVSAAVTLHHCTFRCSEQLIGAATHPAHFESSKKARRYPDADTQQPQLCRDNTGFGSIRAARGVPCIIMERVDEDFPPTRDSNLRQAPASQDIPCLTNLAHVLLGGHCKATSLCRCSGKADRWPVLPVLRFSFSCCVVLLRGIDDWVSPHAPWFCSRHYCFGLPTSVPVLGQGH